MAFKQLLLLCPILTIGAVYDYYSHCNEFGCSSEYVPAPRGKTPSCAKNGRTFCQDIAKYPSEVINSLLAVQAFDLDSFFTTETPMLTQTQRLPVYGAPTEGYRYDYPAYNGTYQRMDQRHQGSSFMSQYHISGGSTPFQFGSSFSIWKRRKRNVDFGIEICPTMTKIQYPKAAEGTDGQWYYVVNNMKYRQTIETKICLAGFLRNDCSSLCGSSLTYTSECGQDYVIQRMLALNKEGAKIFDHTFKIPHGCGCRARQR